MQGLHAHFVPFTAQSRMSGVDIEGSVIRKGAVDAVLAYVSQNSRADEKRLRNCNPLLTQSPKRVARRSLLPKMDFFSVSCT